MTDLATLQDYAARFGGKCLSGEAPTPPLNVIRWECAVGHAWATSLEAFTRGEWCPRCRPNTRKSVQHMVVLAKKYGGEFRSASYQGSNILHEWCCKNGHEFFARPYTFKHRGFFCSQCNEDEKRTRHLARLRAFAASRGGKLLSNEYKEMKSPYLWQCAEKHQWTTTAGHVVHVGTWCPECAGITPGTIEKMRALALTRGGACLSTVYISCKHKLLWRCALNHTWEAIPGAVQRGTWCPTCSRKALAANTRIPRLGIGRMQEIAKERGGLCLSAEYKNAHTRLLWRCLTCGLQWHAKPANIIARGSWCPKCANRQKKGRPPLQKSAEIPQECSPQHDC